VQLAFDDTSVIDVVGIDVGNRGHRARFVLPFEAVEPLPDSSVPLIVRPTRWRRYARQTLADALPSPTSLRCVTAANVTILPFQLEPALAVTQGLGTRLLIADAVGLGKTSQASIVIAESLARVCDGHALVLCPAGLRDQWRHELDTRFGLDASIVDSATITCGARAVDGTINPWAARPVAIASIDYVKRPEVLRGLEELLWDVVVLDEAHVLSGRSDRAAVASMLAARARTVVMVTATPHSGDGDAFARMCDLGRLDGDPPLLVFRRTRRDAGIADARRIRWLWIRPTPAERRMHGALREYADAVWRTHDEVAHPAALAMFVLVRRAASSGHSLARSVERRLELLAAVDDDPGAQLALPFVEPTAEDAVPLAELAAPGLNDLAEERQHLERVLTLARAAAIDESKMRRLRRFIAAAGEPVIVFTEYRDTLTRIAGVLDDLDCVLLHGGMTPAERLHATERFTEGSAMVLLATDAASEGLNLHQRCRLVINLDLPWTPIRLEQRIGRIDRLGQPRTVHAVHFVGRDSSEADVIERLMARDERARASLEAIVHVTARDVANMVMHRQTTLPGACVEPDVTRVGITPHLRRESSIEADRITLARTLRRGSDSIPLARPCATLLRRPSEAACSYWLWRTGIQDNHGDWLWDDYVSIAWRGIRSSSRSAQAIRHALTVGGRALSAPVDLAVRSAIDRVKDASAIPIATLIARERAIATRLADHQATLAAVLIQRGLFDRRAERQTAEQQGTLAAAMARSTRRLDELVRRQQLSAGERHLLFAVFVG
jgi:superfamily II DNA or RNA helicase